MATASTEKVVKIAEAENATLGIKADLAKEDSLLNVRESRQSSANSSLHPREAASAGSLASVPLDTGHDSGIDGEGSDALSELEDELRPLPDGWPRIPEILRRPSCQMSLIVSTCVNKATSHLELLQTIIEEWFKQKELDGSRARMRTASETAQSVYVECKGPHKKQLRFESVRSSAASSKRQERSARSSVAHSTHSHEELSIKGLGAKIPTVKSPSSDHGLDVGELEIPYLGAEEVVSEVVTLLARLETNRLDTEEILRKERARASRLATKIDELMMKRMVELPLTVQREHEACCIDLNELQWHVSYKGRSEDRWKSKVNVADVLNKRLKEDIEFVDKHSPLVMEKLELELEAMRRIEDAQNATNEELYQTQQREQRVIKKSEEAFAKAEMEKDHIKKDLDNVRADLAHISEELAEAKMTYNTYIHQCNDNRIQLKNDEQELVVLQVKNENAKASEGMQEKRVNELESKIRSAEFEHKKSDDKLHSLKKNKEELISSRSQKIKDMELSTEHKQARLRSLNLQNAECEMVIDDCIARLAHCRKQKANDEKNMLRIARELERTETQMDKTMTEFYKVQTINAAVKEQLDTDLEKAMKVEDSLKLTLDSLKKQVKDEIHTRTVIQARITSDSTDLVKSQAEIKHKKVKMGKTLEELEEALRIVLEKVEKLRMIHAEKTRTIQKLESEISFVQKHYDDTEGNVSTKRSELEPFEKTLRDKILACDKKIDHMQWRKEMIQKSTDEMNSATTMMTRTFEQTNRKIKELTEIYDELQIQLAQHRELNEEMQQNLTDVTERTDTNTRKHDNLMIDRQAVLEKQKEDLQSNLELNKQLAIRYRVLQSEVTVLKSNFMDIYDKRVHMENTLKDIKQLSGLQKRMHAALQEYYHIRGLHTENNLQNLDHEAMKNAMRVGVLQDQMNCAIEDITQFLNLNVKEDPVHRVAMSHILKTESGVMPNSSESTVTVK